jgi:hypothetical protein
MALLAHGTHIDAEVTIPARARPPHQMAPGEVALRFPHWSGARRYDKRAKAATHPQSQGWVKQVYEDAIELPGVARQMRGLCFLCAVLLGLPMLLGGIAGLVFLLFLVVSTPSWMDVVLLPFGLFVCGLALYFGFYVFSMFLQADLFVPEDLPVIFDRKHRKVYRLLQDVQPIWWGMSARCPVLACEYEWDLVDVEYRINKFGEGPADENHSLTFLVRKSVDDPTLIGRFQIARADALNGGEADALWEHIRQFMESGGRRVQNPTHPLASLEPPTSWWESMGKVGPFGPGSHGRWKKSPIVTFLIVSMFPLTLPVFLLWGTGHYLSFKTARPVQWPKGVLARIGWPVSDTPGRKVRSAFS